MSDQLGPFEDFNTMMRDWKLQAFKEDPGLLEAYTEARELDQDIGWVDVQEQRQQESKGEKTNSDIKA